MSFNMTENEKLIELLMIGILLDQVPALLAVRALLIKYSEAELDSLVLACSRTAAALEEWYSAPAEIKTASDELWRIASLLACESVILRQSGVCVPKVSDAIVFWLDTGNDLFLDQ